MPADWTNGIAEAVERMREHLDDKTRTHIRFDARDRAALAFILDRAAECVWIARFAEDSIGGVYATEELCKAEVDRLNDVGDTGMWEVERWTIRRAAGNGVDE